MEVPVDPFHVWKELTCSQDQIYLSDVHYGSTPLHNLTFAFSWNGLVDLATLQEAFDHLVRESGCLRIRVQDIKGRGRQMVQPDSDLCLQVVDFSARPDPRGAYAQWADELGHRVTPLDTLVLGSWFAQVEAQCGYWVITMHHLVADSWGIYLLFERLKALYADLLDDGMVTSLPLPPYEVLLESDQRYRESGQFHTDQAYWRDILASTSGRVQLYGYAGAAKVIPVIRKHTHLAPGLARKLVQRAGEADFAAKTVNISLFNLLFTAFAAYLYRVSGQRDFLVAVPYLNRRGILRQIPGLAIQGAPVRVNIQPGESFRALFARVVEETRSAAEHSLYPVPNPNNAHYNVMFNFHNRPYHASDEPVETWWFNDTEVVDLSLNIFNPDPLLERFPLGFDIPQPLLDAVGAETIMRHFTSILEAMLDDPDCALEQAGMLSAEEKHALLGGMEAISIPDIGTVFARAFAEPVQRAPDAAALVLGPRRLTYRELDQRSNALAAALRAGGVRPGSPVGMLLEQRFDMVIGLVGIMKSGGLYVPLDPTYPDDRLAYMLRDAGIDILVTEPAMAARTAHFSTRQINIHDLPPAPDGFMAHIPEWDEPGYITYTSGSTGRPKGVVTSHGALANDTAAMRDYLRLTPQDHFLFFAAIGFDAAFEEILPALISGATVIPRPGGLLSVDEFNRLLRDEGVTAMSIPAAFWSEWTAGLARSGESIPDSLVKMMVYAEEPNIQSYITWRTLPGADRVRWINTYGPTEAAITTTMFEPGPSDGDPASWPRFPIGWPLPNHSVYVLDRDRNLVARGVPGELYIGGDVALRYQNMPDESAAVFLPDPFRAEPGSRMYKTGDRARVLPDGNLEFLGRFDNQVKLHGFRIELGEIESRLSAHPSVRQAVVLVRGQHGAKQRLVAYVVPEYSSFNHDEVLPFLSESLPAYMLPSDFVVLDQFPVTPNGKIDKKALPDPEIDTGPAGGIELPETNLEIELVAIWENILGVTPIGVTQNYFDLGGNSLLGVRIFSILESKLGLRLPVSELFRAPTIRQLARYIENHQYNYRPSTVVLMRPGGSGKPIFFIHGWGGGVVGYASLIRELDPRWPVYGIQAAGVSQGEAPDETMEAMVERYIQAIKEVQPQGPYRLGGYCTGGVIAYAVACELTRQGDAVDVLANIEGEPPHIRQRSPRPLSGQRLAIFFRSIPFWIKDYRELGMTGLRQRILSVIRTARRARQFNGKKVEYNHDDIILDDTTPLPDFQRDLLLKQVQMMESYFPTPYSGRMAVYAARYPTIMSAMFGPLDYELGWSGLVKGGLAVYIVNSGHRNIHLLPYARELAAAIQQELERADRALQTEKQV